MQKQGSGDKRMPAIENNESSSCGASCRKPSNETTIGAVSFCYPASARPHLARSGRAPSTPQVSRPLTSSAACARLGGASAPMMA